MLEAEGAEALEDFKALAGADVPMALLLKRQWEGERVRETRGVERGRWVGEGKER